MHDHRIALCHAGVERLGLVHDVIGYRRGARICCPTLTDWRRYRCTVFRAIASSRESR
jgi:hypothetical protein